MTETKVFVIDLWGADPVSQGSKTPVPLVRSFPVTVTSARHLLSLVGMRESAKRLPAWRQALRHRACQLMDEHGLATIETAPVTLHCTFVFKRPLSHFGTGKNAGVLKPYAPVYRTSAPDKDKLERAVGDSLSSAVFRDDAQIVGGGSVKVYTNAQFPEPGVLIRVSTLGLG